MLLTIFPHPSLDSPFSTFRFASQTLAILQRGLTYRKGPAFTWGFALYSSMLFTNVNFITLLLALWVPAHFPLTLSFALLLVASIPQYKAALSPPPSAAALSSTNPMTCSVWSSCLPALCQFSPCDLLCKGFLNSPHCSPSQS